MGFLVRTAAQCSACRGELSFWCAGVGALLVCPTTFGLTYGSSMLPGGCEVQAEQPSGPAAYPAGSNAYYYH